MWEDVNDSPTLLGKVGIEGKEGMVGDDIMTYFIGKNFFQKKIGEGFRRYDWLSKDARVKARK